MCKTREQQILENLENNLPSDTKHSNNIELEEYLDKIVEGMCNIIFEKTHAECRMTKDIKVMLEHIRKESKEVNKIQLDLLLDELNNLETYIKCIKSGNLGEKQAFTELRHLAIDDMTTIVQNITLRVDDEEIAEYDDLVISPNGIFIIEVKNRADNAKIDKSGNLIFNRCNVLNYSRDARRRKFILKEIIKNSLIDAGMYDADIGVEEILLWTNVFSHIENYKPQSVITKRTDEICDFIDSYPCRRKLTSDEIAAIAKTLKEKSIQNKYDIQEVHLKSLYERFAYVISTYENEKIKSITAEVSEEVILNPENKVDIVKPDDYKVQKLYAKHKKGIAFTALGVLIGGVMILWGSKKVSKS